MPFPVCKSPREGLAHTGTAWPGECAHEICTPQVGSPALIPLAHKSPAAQITPSFTGSHRGCDGRDSRSLTTHVRQAHFTVADRRWQSNTLARRRQRGRAPPLALLVGLVHGAGAGIDSLDFGLLSQDSRTASATRVGRRRAIDCTLTDC
jgi:hypothetical protein